MYCFSNTSLKCFVEDQQSCFQYQFFEVLIIFGFFRSNSITKNEMADKFEQLEDNLEQFIETVRQLGIIVSDFQPQGQNVLYQKINSLVNNLKDIESCKSALSDVYIPLEVFDCIDAGKNPQLFTKDCIEKALSKNEAVKGKIDVYKKFRQDLITQLSAVYPEIEQYKKLRGEA